MHYSRYVLVQLTDEHNVVLQAFRAVESVSAVAGG
jgi:hypothetical protein